MSTSKVIISLIMAISMFQSTTAQLITQAKGGQYAYDGIIYEYEELENILEKNIVSYRTYQNAIDKAKSSKILGFISLGSLVTGLSLIALDNPNPHRFCEWCITTGDVVGVVLAIVVTPISGTMGIISGFGAIGQRRKSIDYFNQTQIIGFDNSHELQWTVGITQNGLGVSLIF